jgi:hypothetical protein
VRKERLELEINLDRNNQALIGVKHGRIDPIRKPAREETR